MRRVYWPPLPLNRAARHSRYVLTLLERDISCFFVEPVERVVEQDDGRVVIDLERVAEVHVRIVGGEVSIGGTAAPPRLEVECLQGEPVVVTVDDGIVVVEHDISQRRWFGR